MGLRATDMESKSIERLINTLLVLVLSGLLFALMKVHNITSFIIESYSLVSIFFRFACF